MNSDTPWWFIPLVTFAGVLLAQCIVVLLYFARQRAEDKRRWHDKRREVYADYARAALKAYRLFLTSSDGSDIDRKLLGEALDTIDELQLDVDLLSSDPVKDKATVLQATLDMIRMSSADVPMPKNEDILLARLEFEEVVREELGISKAPERVILTADGGWDLFREITIAAAKSAWKTPPWKMFSKRRIVVVHRRQNDKHQD